MPRDDRFDVFLSYAHSDGAAAAELNRWLRAQGFRTFFDQSELCPGLRWIAALEDAIGRSDAVAILVGAHGIGNTQQYERELALVRQSGDTGFPVIPVLMPGYKNAPTGFLQLLTWIDLSQGASLLQQTDSLEALRGAIRRQPVASSRVRDLICPYRGLEPFREEDAAFFCGRDQAIHDLVQQVRSHSFVAVVGPSGSGKSSLVYAGLFPELRKQRQTIVWDVLSIRPGASPLRALAAAFGNPIENAGPAAIDHIHESEAAAYRAGDTAKLDRIVKDRLDAAPEKPDRLLIYIDQWEELYTMVPAAEDKVGRQQHTEDVDKFIALLHAATAGRQSRASVVLTIRADFYGALMKDRLVSTLLPRQQVNLHPMGQGDLRCAIEMPAEKAGLSFESAALVDEILSDVGVDEGRLPLLEFALKEMWGRREGNLLTAKAYTEVGGVTGAIQKTAEHAYAALTPAQQDAARRLFLRLVTPGEGREDTRARCARPDDAEQQDIIDRFSAPRTRLLVTGFDTVEVAHEALIRRWPTLRGWVDENREKLRARAAILQAQKVWEEAGEIDEFLLRSGVELERGRALVQDPGDVAVDDLRDYVTLSIAKEDQARDAALAVQRQIAEAERQAKLAAEEAVRQAEARAAAERHAKLAAEVAQRKLQGRLVQTGVAGTVALLAFAVSIVAWNSASKNASEAALQAREARLQTEKAQEMEKEKSLELARASKALAEGLLNDLDLVANEALTERQRNALWKLTLSENLVRREFAAALSAHRDNLVRVVGGFRMVSRSLGSRDYMQDKVMTLFDRAIAAIEGNARDARTAGSLVIVVQDLAPKLSEAQRQQGLESILQRIAKTTDSFSILTLAQAIRALPAKLTEPQEHKAMAPILRRIGQTTDPGEIQALAEAIRTLAPKLTGADAGHGLEPLLHRLQQTTDPDAIQAMVDAIQALAPNLTGGQAQAALELVQKQIGSIGHSFALQALARVIPALAQHLTEEQAQDVLALLAQRMSSTTDPSAVQVLAEAIVSLPATLAPAQVQQVLAWPLLKIGQTTDYQVLQALARAIRALAPRLAEAPARQAVIQLLQQMGRTADPLVLQALAEVILSMPTNLDQTQAQRALAALLQQIGRTHSDAFPALGEIIQALARNLTEDQTRAALAPLLTQIGRTRDSYELRALAEGIRALPTNLSPAQAQQALAPLLTKIGGTNRHALPELTRAIRALAPKVPKAHAQLVLAQLVQLMSQPIDLEPEEISALAEAIRGLPPKLSMAQAQQALDPLLQRISETIPHYSLQALAQALQAIAPKLAEPQRQQALTVAGSSLAWASTEDEAAEWARTIVALVPDTADRHGARHFFVASRSSGQDVETPVRDDARTLAAAIAYPSAAGPATDILSDALRTRHSDAPPEAEGTPAMLAWLEQKYPDLLLSPTCPPPPQSNAPSSLRCPDREHHAIHPSESTR
jgi:hypothetical protein